MKGNNQEIAKKICQLYKDEIPVQIVKVLDFKDTELAKEKERANRAEHFLKDHSDDVIRTAYQRIKSLEQKCEELQADKQKFTLYFKEKSITLMQGMGAWAVWLELEDGEGGDFEQAGLYQIIRRFYDERF